MRWELENIEEINPQKKITMLRKKTEKVVITVVYKESKLREAE